MLLALFYDKDGNLLEQKPLPFRGEEVPEELLMEEEPLEKTA